MKQTSVYLSDLAVAALEGRSWGERKGKARLLREIIEKELLGR